MYIKVYIHIYYKVILDFTDFEEHMTCGCKLVGIELHKDSIPLSEYNRPKQVCYLLGVEDFGLTKEAINACQDLIILPGERSMNVSVAGSIVLYGIVSKKSVGKNV